MTQSHRRTFEVAHDTDKVHFTMITLYRLNCNQDPRKLASKIEREGTLTISNEHVKAHEEPVSKETRFKLMTGETLTLAEFLGRFGKGGAEILVKFINGDADEDDVMRHFGIFETEVYETRSVLSEFASDMREASRLDDGRKEAVEKAKERAIERLRSL